MEKQTKIKKVRRKYDEGFKTEAVRMVNGGGSVPDVARLLGMSENLLYTCASNYARLKWSGIFKKSLDYFRTDNVPLLYKTIQVLLSEYAVRVLCRVLSVCFSSFYTWRRGGSFRPSAARVTSTQQVKKVFFGTSTAL